MIGAVALPGLSEDDTQRGRGFLRTAEVQPERWSEVRTNDRVLDAGNAAATTAESSRYSDALMIPEAQRGSKDGR